MSTKKDEKKAANADKNEKNSKFALKLSELRRERGISQKKAATDLGISQALLSHYEKGIRECGLDFVIRCSEYYSVTTDYLLGVSESRNGFDVDAMNQQEEENGEFSVFTLGKATLNEFLSFIDMAKQQNICLTLLQPEATRVR